MSRIKLERVDNPDSSSQSILELQITPGIKSKGDTDYLCAGCGKTLLRKVSYKQVQNLVFKCPHCGTYSRIPTAHHAH